MPPRERKTERGKGGIEKAEGYVQNLNKIRQEGARILQSKYEEGQKKVKDFLKIKSIISPLVDVGMMFIPGVSQFMQAGKGLTQVGKRAFGSGATDFILDLLLKPKMPGFSDIPGGRGLAAIAGKAQDLQGHFKEAISKKLLTQIAEAGGKGLASFMLTQQFPSMFKNVGKLKGKLPTSFKPNVNLEIRDLNLKVPQKLSILDGLTTKPMPKVDISKTSNLVSKPSILDSDIMNIANKSLPFTPEASKFSISKAMSDPSWIEYSKSGFKGSFKEWLDSANMPMIDSYRLR